MIMMVEWHDCDDGVVNTDNILIALWHVKIIMSLEPNCSIIILYCIFHNM